MKLKVKSHVQQERNMRGHKDKFPTPPPDLNKRDGPYKPRVPTKEDDGVNPFARQLASGDKEVRDATFAALGKWLGARADVPLLDMKKIWKGLFYAMWHADGWDVQEELAEQIAGLTHALRHKVALTYLGVFYITARREWVGIDRHRMDKYLRLVRRVTSHALRYCANRDWRADVVQDIASVFEKAALVAGTKGMVDVGLRLHISELFVGELRKVAAGKDKVTVGCDPDDPNEANGGAPRTVFRKTSSTKNGHGDKTNKRKAASSTNVEPKTHKPSLVPSTATESFLNAFAAVLQFDQHKPLHRRVLGSVFEAAAEGADGGVAQQALLSEDFEFDEDEEDGIDPKVRKEALAAATMVRLDAATMKRMSKRFIELGAADGVEDLNRESLYHVHTLFRKAAKRAAKAEQAEEASVSMNEELSKKKRKKAEPEVKDEPMEESESEEELEESFHTAASESEDEDEDEDEDDSDVSDEEENLTPSKRVNLKGTFDDVGDAEEEDEFEEADEFEDVEMEEEEEEEEEEDDQDDSLESLDDSDLDNSDDEQGSESSDTSGDEDADSDEEMARHEAAVAAGIAAAERKALRKAERWAAAVGATPPPASNALNAVKGQRVSAQKISHERKNNALLSPSKRVLWNLKRNTRHTPTGPPNPVKGDGLRALLNTTPRKSLLRPIHAAASFDRNPPGSDPGARRSKGHGHGEKDRKEKRETMTPGRKKVKASTFF